MEFPCYNSCTALITSCGKYATPTETTSTGCPVTLSMTFVPGATPAWASNASRCALVPCVATPCACLARITVSCPIRLSMSIWIFAYLLRRRRLALNVLPARRVHRNPHHLVQIVCPTAKVTRRRFRLHRIRLRLYLRRLAGINVLYADILILPSPVTYLLRRRSLLYSVLQ